MQKNTYNSTTTDEKGTKAKPPPRVLPRKWTGGIVGQNLHHVSTKCNKKKLIRIRKNGDKIFRNNKKKQSLWRVPKGL